jgi:energy-coupling factor transport system permease protein
MIGTAAASRHRHRRLVHPGAWWIWAAGTAAAALRTTNPLLLALIVAAVAVVVANRRQAAPWARSFGGFFKLAIIMVIFRVVMQMLFGARIGEHVLFVLPSLELPAWAAGVSVGGPVTVELLVAAVYSSLQLATVLICFGAVNSLCSPYRLLRSLPAVLYEAGVVVTVALAFAPQTVVAVGRVREARRLRGRPTKGARGWQGMAMPVLERALEQSVALAASMDARGYGRRGDLSARARRGVAAATALGLLLICVGVYALLDVSAPRLLSLPMLAIGSAALALGLFSKGRHSLRTRYRADPWRAAEWATSASGLLALGLMIVAATNDPAVLSPPTFPLTWPTLTLLPIAAAAVVLSPAWCTPPPPGVLGAVGTDEPDAETALQDDRVAA